MGVAGFFLSHTFLILQINITFKDVQMMFKWFLISLLVSDFQGSVGSVQSISVAVLELTLSQPGWGYKLCPSIYYLPSPDFQTLLRPCLGYINNATHEPFTLIFNTANSCIFLSKKLVWIIVKIRQDVMKTWIFVFTVLLTEKPV